MTSDLEQAKALAGIIVLLGAVGPILWMANNMGTADPKQFMEVGASVVWRAAVPAFGLIAFFLVAIKFSSLSNEI